MSASFLKGYVTLDGKAYNISFQLTNVQAVEYRKLGFIL
jgi:hypothetical protein